MYWGEKECMGQSFACTIGLHPSTLAHLSRIANMNVTKCFLYVLGREGMHGVEFFLHNSLASINFNWFE
jgi:hypothetical protein